MAMIFFFECCPVCQSQLANLLLREHVLRCATVHCVVVALSRGASRAAAMGPAVRGDRLPTHAVRSGVPAC